MQLLSFHSALLRGGCRFLRNITIPASFITKSDGQVLKDLFKKTPGNTQPDDVYVVLDWNDVLPRAQKVTPHSHCMLGCTRHGVLLSSLVCALVAHGVLLYLPAWVAHAMVRDSILALLCATGKVETLRSS